MKRATHFGGVLLFILAGPLVWAAHLFAVYGAHAVICARLPAQQAILPFLFLALNGAGLALLALALLRPESIARVLLGRGDDAESDFLRALMRMLVLLSAFGVGWASIATLLLPHCVQLR